MSFVKKCEQEGCEKSAEHRCFTETVSVTLCPCHVMEMLSSTPMVRCEMLYIPASDQDINNLENSIKAFEEASRETQAQEQQRMQTTVELLRSLIPQIEQCSSDTRARLKEETQTIVGHLNELVEAQKFPREHQDSFLMELSQLKAQEGLSEGAITNLVKLRLHSVIGCANDALMANLAQALDSLNTNIKTQALSERPPRVVHGKRPVVWSVKDAEELQRLCRAGCVFKGLHLQEMALQDIDLSGGIFVDCKFENVSFNRVHLDRTILWNSIFKHCKLLKITITPRTVFKAHTSITSLAFSLHQPTIVLGAQSGAGTWDAPSSLTTLISGTPVSAVAISADDSAVAVHGTIIQVWKRTKTPYLKLKGRIPIALSAEPTLLASLAGQTGNTIVLHHLKTGRILGMLSLFTVPITALCFYNGRASLLVGNKHGEVHHYDLKRAKIVFTFPSSQEEVSFLYASRSQPTLIARYGNRTIKLWDIETQRLIREIALDENTNSPIAISPCFTYFVVVCKNTEIHLYNLTGERRYIYRGYGEIVTALAISPCGLYILAGSADGTVNYSINWVSLVDDQILTLPEDPILFEFQYSGCQLIFTSGDTTRLDEYP